MKLKEAQTKLAEAGISTAELDALILAELATGEDRTHLLAHPNTEIDFGDLIEKRSKRIPLAHLTGTKEFYGLEFSVSPGVLQPRPESEKIVELAIKYAPKNSKLLDVGTGCGALAIAIAKHRSDITVHASEISPQAMKVALQNIQKHDANVKLIESDLLSSVEDKYSTVVANLPYLKNDAQLLPEVKNEPRLALFGGIDGLELYRTFFKHLPAHLESGGHVFTESDPWQQPELIKIAGHAGFQKIEQDYFVLGFRN